MTIVDTHVHIALNTYEPAEILLAQMENNGVAKTLLVQTTTTFDNTYMVECVRRYPGRFSVVCRVDVASPTALADLERWRQAGCESVRLRNFHRSPGADPLAIWRKANDLGMSVSVGGPVTDFIKPEFTKIVESFPKLTMILEHLAGMGLNAVREGGKPSEAEYRQALQLAKYPNTVIKIHGIGEIAEGMFPYRQVPPYTRWAYDAFGAKRMIWGSDWPRVILREGYRNALRYTMENLSSYCSQDDLDWIFGKTALGLWKFP